jgi:AcrR family transcriptional regulator
LHVFLQRGFARATTREIAQTAGVAEGTIYRHFPDKYALFHDVFRSLTAGVVGELLRFRERAGHGTVRDNLEYLFCMVGGIQEQLSSLMASMWADPDLARNVGARARELAPDGFVPPGPVSMVAEYIRAEQELGRIRDDVDPLEAAATVVSVPFAAGMERALSTHPDMSGEFPVPDDFSLPAAGALDILARGLAPSAEAAGS